jgi:CheY-like chemotaxis protein
MAILICATFGTEAIPVARALKAEPATKEIPIVGFSAHTMPEDEARALQAGCIVYLRKPLDTRRFLDLMERLLGGARQ